MDLSIGDFDTFVGVLARFTVAAYVVHATAPEGRVTNEHGAQTIEQMLGEAGLPTGLMGKEPSQKLLRLGGRERFHLLWAERIKEACAPLCRPSDPQ